ncbi:enolase C-terminal domain-like protein [Roseobacter sinensis]|uniref:Enolase n=1 Tax=Roseobacter sinensis TaxID=2931391 RepID=A0ABT3BFF2_9RHOB|nr:enolase C-terminal domain-like protein [Roseobacter sp. WL0113]MCV3272297.1 enolase [Roseobacter sp. WL0113]
MKALAITSVRLIRFRTETVKEKDSDGHDHPCAPRPTTLALLSIDTDAGVTGEVLCPPSVLRAELLEAYIRPILLDQNPFDRERLWQAMARWQRGAAQQLTDKAIGYVDHALWDLAGKALGLPVWRLIGGARNKVPAYGSTMCGDERKEGLATPEDYGHFAEALVARGYQAIKLHTWMPPVSWAPSVRMDIAACAAVREAVGSDIALMLDANHWYSRTEALTLGRGIEALGYLWYEEPMEEASTSSYRWLSQQLSIPVIGPESAPGKHFTRAEWAASGACDVLRTGVNDVGGITPAIKCVHLAQSFNMEIEVHGGGVGNLALIGGTGAGRYYERGLLHPFLDHDAPPPHLTAIPDPMDADGLVHLSEAPGLGDALDRDFIAANTLPD